MKGPSLGPGEEDITWSDQFALWGRKASNTRNLKTSNLKSHRTITPCQSSGHWTSGWNTCSPRMLSGTLLQTRVMLLH